MKKVAHPDVVSDDFSRLTWAQGYVMTETKTDRRSTPVATVDLEVIAFRQEFE
jgi:hypothetical protein